MKNIVSVDFFVVPTVQFLYVFLVLAHDRNWRTHLSLAKTPHKADEHTLSTRVPSSKFKKSADCIITTNAGLPNHIITTFDDIHAVDSLAQGAPQIL